MRLCAPQLHLIAKLLEDRATMCIHNEHVCRELQAFPTAFYWNEQYRRASDLAVCFRETAKEIGKGVVNMVPERTPLLPEREAL